MNYKQARELLNNYEVLLPSLGDVFNNQVHIVHQDGSMFKLNNASYSKKDGWYFIMIEHSVPLVFHEGDLEIIFQVPIYV